MTKTHDLSGQHLGQYEIMSVLGTGGMATVYRAQQTLAGRVKREVAIKVIESQFASDEDFVARFEREAQLIISLSHAHVLKVFDYGQDNDVVYLVMELLSGGSLAGLISNGALPVDKVNNLLRQIADALDYAHHKGIIHRDLKPGNVLLDESGDAFLSDFGIAKLLDSNQTLTQSGVMVGTPLYMAPEQWQGKAVDGRADIYALGIILFEMLTTIQPFKADTPYSTMHKHLNEPLPSVLAIRPDLPANIQGVLNKALAKNADDRFNTAGDLASAFRLTLNGQTVMSSPVVSTSDQTTSTGKMASQMSSRVHTKFPQLFALYEQTNRQTIQEVGAIHEGLSGANVLLVHLGQNEGTGRGGMAYAKIARLTRELGEDFSPLERERENHLMARQIPCAEQFIGEVRDMVGPDEAGLGMLVYRPAHGTLSVRSLGEVVDKIATNEYRISDVVGQVNTLLQALRACWYNADEMNRTRLSNNEFGDLLTVPDLLEMLIQAGQYSTLDNRFGGLDDRIATLDLPDKRSRLIDFRPGNARGLPNPVAYILDSSLWAEFGPILAPKGPTHGDLHGGNIMCRLNAQNAPFELPQLIDFASYRPDGVLFLDLAYLELDLIVRTLPVDSTDEYQRENWLSLTEFLASDILPDGEPVAGARNTWELIKPIRQHVFEMLRQVQGDGIKEQFEGVWWLSTMVAGTLIMSRRNIARDVRVATLMYASHCLESYLRLNKASIPTEGRIELWWNEEPWDTNKKGSPFLGLDTFRPEYADIFYGRNREIEGVVQRLDTHRFVAVVGASGSGKSSLVWAGVLPRLNKNWITVRFTPGGTRDGNPFAALAAALTDPQALPRLGQKEPLLAAKLRLQPDLLDKLCDDALRAEPDKQILLFIDQFEELFTLVDSIIDEGYRTRFVVLLSRVLTAKRIRVIVTLRHDFQPACFAIPELVNLLQDRTFMLNPPNVIALTEMITRAALRAGITFDEGLVSRILVDTDTTHNPGALALMAYTLKQLYAKSPDGKRLTLTSYEEIGGVQGALAAKATEVYDALEDEPEVQAALPTVFQALVNVDEDSGAATRRRALKAELTVHEASSRLIDVFSAPDARLLVMDNDAQNEPVIEVAHEAMLRSWPRLVTWIDETKYDLQLWKKVQRDALEWQRRGRPTGLLYRQPQIDEVKLALDRLRPPLLSDYLQTFLRDEWEWLVAELADPSAIIPRRVDIGDTLSAWPGGDPRPGIGLRSDGLPDIVWCEVNGEPPMDEFLFGEKRERRKLDTFFIAKYPVTYLQYQAFLNDPEGFANPEWTAGLHKDARQQQAKGSGDQKFKRSNRPAEMVSWYDAMGFCAWLKAKYTASGALDSGAEIRLPTEEEWEKAARGSDGRLLPYGDQFDPARANTAMTGLGQTTAVGIFPAGASPYGIMDMSGNVWEWTLTDYDTNSAQDLVSNRRRVLRGGSWTVDAWLAPMAIRNNNDPTQRTNNIGFRLACKRRID